MQNDALERLRRDVWLLKLYSLGTTVVVLVLALAAFGPDRARFGEIDVERINVVNPDGGLALVLSNSERMPGGIFEGEEIIDHRDGVAGLIFYNAKGDEVGGLTFRGEWTENGYAAGGHLSFDQFQQDQVVAMTYKDDGDYRWSGFMVYDRPTDITIADFVTSLKAFQASSGEAREAVLAEFRELAGRQEIPRVLLGSENRTASVRLSDTAGRERIRLFVDSNDVAVLEFLDDQGQVILRLPE